MPDQQSMHDSDPSDEEPDASHQSEANTRKRSSRACTFLGPSHKRGPPKGYIHAIEQRWHQVESVLGAILSSPDPQVQLLIQNLRKDELARDIISRVDLGPFGPTGRANHSVAVTKEDFFTSIMNNTESSRDPSRPRRQSRVSREIVSSNNSMLVSPTLEWQDRLSSRFATTSTSADLRFSSSRDVLAGTPMGPPLQRRRTDGGSAEPDWDRMYRIESKSDSEEDSDGAPATGFGQLSLDENKEVRYHGFASGLPLLYNSERTDDRKFGGMWKLPMARVWPPAAQKFIAEESVNVSLPPVELQRHLLDLYFTYVHPIFPVVHKTLFWMEFEAANSPGNERRPISERPHMSNLLLLSMLAIAARYDEAENLPTSGNMWEAGLTYMIQAREVLNRIYHYSRPSTCQALLLLGLREFGLGSMEHGWLYIGMALRMAQDLGLNRDGAHWEGHGRKLFTHMELQARRQIWWACNRADKHTAVWMGRPPTIPDTSYDTLMPQDDSDELWKPHPMDPASLNYNPVPSRTLEAFRQASVLSVIVGLIVERIYPIRPITGHNKRAALVELEGRLDKWLLELPESLSFDASSKRTTPPPNILVMHMTYWNAVLLLHRAFIPKWKTVVRSSSKTTRDSDALSLKSFDICQSAATHITSLVVAYQAQYSLRRAALLLTHHMFSAGIMHVVTLTMRPSNIQASVNLQQILGALKEMGFIWPSAQRAWDLLNGAKVHVDNGLLASFVATTNDRKRAADDAFSEERSPSLLNRTPFEPQPGGENPPSPAVISEDASNRMLAQMLGLDIPGLEPSTSYFPGYEWWPRNGNGRQASGTQGQGSGSGSQTFSTPSPQSSHSSPPSTMPIPFGFDQTQGMWLDGSMSLPPESYGPIDYTTPSAFNPGF
ncbi:hypothetical protein EVG20_g10211 [Dentipellis fragilis]|uniref:Xylanolytic transcriptional activator regulatory domain-containing protein n=1 Tax=Dentipellis fragilis TaxID=205917 RepID=A0A4Y9XSW1_9AGAM|nr:hypothetical protein EVG20_g10211 [Dentipellis fragilis]